jgi:hypothetical protein
MSKQDDLSRTGNLAQRMDRLNRIIEFFERYASAGRGAPLSTAAEPAPEASERRREGAGAAVD